MTSTKFHLKKPESMVYTYRTPNGVVRLEWSESAGNMQDTKFETTLDSVDRIPDRLRPFVVERNN